MALRTPSQNEEEQSYRPPDWNPKGPSAEELERIPTASQEGVDHLRSGHTGGEQSPTYKPTGTGGVYDSENDTTAKPGLAGNPADRPKKLSSDEISSRENGGTTGESNSDEATKLGLGGGKNNPGSSGGLYSGEEKDSTLQRFKSKFTRRRSIIGGLVGGAILGGVFSFSVVQGPLQFIHIAQMLQNFHFSDNDNFSNRRTIKLLQYVISDNRAERTRLGVATNKVADLWEQRIADDTGLRPVYSKDTGRFAGFEVIDEDKAKPIIDEWERNNGAVSQVSDAGGQGIQGTKKNQSVGAGNRFLDARQENPRATRALVNTVGKSTRLNNIASSLGSRLLKKRGGVDFAPLKNKVRERADNAADRRAERQAIREEAASRDREGVDSAGRARVDPIGQDEEGKDVTDPNAEQAAQDADEAIKQAEDQLESPGEQSASQIRQSIARGLGGAAVVGVLCSVKGFGDNIEDYKYTKNAVPMIRMGMRAVTVGSQLMSGNNVSEVEMEALYDSLYDPETKTSWANASTIQAELGQERAGPEVPQEASFKNIGSKPALFNTIDSIPGLGSACGVMDSIFGIPVLKEVSGLISSISSGALGAVGIDTDELMGKALAAASGNSVDLLSKGADWGNLVNQGSFLAANDNAISGGGGRLTPTQSAQLRQIRLEDKQYENSQKSFYARYFDVYDGDSLASTAISKTPASYQQLSNPVLDPLKSVASFFSGSINLFTPRAYAQASVDPEEVYGVPKYGFSNELEASPVFENPLEGAEKVEAEIDSLNEKYSECFNLKVILTSDGPPRLETLDKTVNTFKLEKERDLQEKCDPNINRDNLFNQYRFYIHDVKNSTALNCYEGSDDACGDLGAGGASGSEKSGDSLSTSEEVDGDFKIKKISPALSGSRSGGEITPKGVTLHWWGGQYDRGIEGLVSIFKGNGLSVQLGITSDGGVYQLTKSLTTRTSHAIGGNSTTIGIEIEGGPEQFGKEGIEKYPEKFEAVVNTVKYLVKKYDIPLEKNVECNNASGILQHKDFNKCDGAAGKSDVDDYYYNEVMKRVRS